MRVSSSAEIELDSDSLNPHYAYMEDGAKEHQFGFWMLSRR